MSTVSKGWFASILTFYIVSLDICKIELAEWTETIFRMSVKQYYQRFSSLWIEMRMVAANHSARLPQKQQDHWIHSDGLSDQVCAEISVSLGLKPAHVYCLSSLPTFCRLGWKRAMYLYLSWYILINYPTNLITQGHMITLISIYFEQHIDNTEIVCQNAHIFIGLIWRRYSLSAVSSSTLCQIEPWEWTETIFRISLQQYYQVQVLYGKKYER